MQPFALAGTVTLASASAIAEYPSIFFINPSGQKQSVQRKEVDAALRLPEFNKPLARKLHYSTHLLSIGRQSGSYNLDRDFDRWQAGSRSPA
jgi:hypothetical protein